VRRYRHRLKALEENQRPFHGVDLRKPVRRMREQCPETFQKWVGFEGKVFADGALPAKTKSMICLGIAQITQCAWCIGAHTKKALSAGAPEAELAEVTFVAMAIAGGAAWTHGGLLLHCAEEQAPPSRVAGAQCWPGPDSR
jgi:AhpD family alkylhydroperoxidase